MTTELEQPQPELMANSGANPGEGDSQSNNKDGAYTDLKFAVGDKILAFHSPLWYKAKVLDIDPEQGYFIHYDKWSTTWDEWVKPERTLGMNEENLKLM